MGNAFIVNPYGFATASAPNGSAAGTSPIYTFNDYIGMVWRSTLASGTDGVDYDLGAARNVDFVAMLSSNGLCSNQQIFGATAQANLGLSGYASASVIFPAGATTPTSLRQNSFYDLGGVHAYRWWRFNFVALSAAVDAGRVIIGQKTTLARNFTFDAHARGVRDFGSVDFTRDGGLLRRTGVKLRRLEIGWQSNTLAETEAAILPLIETVGATTPILIVTNPDVDAQRSNRMYFGFLTSDLATPIRQFDTWVWRASLISVI